MRTVGSIPVSFVRAGTVTNLAFRPWDGPGNGEVLASPRVPAAVEDRWTASPADVTVGFTNRSRRATSRRSAPVRWRAGLVQATAVRFLFRRGAPRLALQAPTARRAREGED